MHALRYDRNVRLFLQKHAVPLSKGEGMSGATCWKDNAWGTWHLHDSRHARAKQRRAEMQVRQGQVIQGRRGVTTSTM